MGKVAGGERRRRRRGRRVRSRAVVRLFGKTSGGMEATGGKVDVEGGFGGRAGGPSWRRRDTEEGGTGTMEKAKPGR